MNIMEPSDFEANFTAKPFGSVIPLCAKWRDGSENSVYHLANIFLCLGLMGGSGIFGVLYVFTFLTSGFFCASLWAWMDSCTRDAFLWFFALFAVCSSQVLHTAYRIRSVSFERDFQELYNCVFKKVGVSLPQFGKIVTCCGGVIHTLEKDHCFAVEGKTAIDKLSLLMTGRLSPAERNYGIGDRELLAEKMALEEWRHHLEGASQPFVVLTDHKNLEYLKSAQRLNSRQARIPTTLSPTTTYHDLALRHCNLRSGLHYVLLGIRVTVNGELLHFTYPFQFLDSPEWDSLRPSEEGVFQVTLSADYPCTYIAWRRKSLYLLFAKHRYIARIFALVVRNDIAEKLSSLYYKAFNCYGHRYDLRLPTCCHMPGTEIEKADVQSKVRVQGEVYA
ncbi:popeye domain-containing protein 3 [Stigmatopora argus]